MAENPNLKLPYGKSIFPEIAGRSTMAWPAQVAFLLLSLVIGVIIVPVLPILVGAVFHLHNGWDEERGITLGNLPKLLRESLQLSSSEILWISEVSLSAYVILFIVDRWFEFPESPYSPCYEDMFSEPSRGGITHVKGATSRKKSVLVSRPGNTYTNIFYLFGGLCITISSLRSAYNVPDFLFGITLLFLTIMSTIWHSRHIVWVQYLDLWSMEACIAYLIIRFVCMGVFIPINSLQVLNEGYCIFFTSLLCAATYIYFMIVTGFSMWRQYKKGTLDIICTFSGRRQLISKEKNVRRNITIVKDVCPYYMVPFMYLIIPALVQVLVGSVGSLLAGLIASTSLAAGWSLRSFERFCLDGWVPMIFVKSRIGKTDRGHWTLAAGLVSPTAIFHICTGVTLLFAYMQTRSVEQVMLST